MLEAYQDVVPLVNKSDGWRESQVRISHDTSPVFDTKMRAKLEEASSWTLHNRTREFSRYNDTNGPKAGVKRLSSSGEGLLAVSTVATDYFTLRGLQETHPELHDQALEDLETGHPTDVPIGISTHNIILLSTDGSRRPDNTYIAMIINNDQHGFAAGKLSVSYEGMLDPSVDLTEGKLSTFKTVKRTLRKEFGIVNPAEIRLLAVCAEKQSQYTSWCHVVWISGTPEDLLAIYGEAPRPESTVLFAVPLREIDAYTQNKIGFHVYHDNILKGSLDEEATLPPHPTVPWRVDALKEYMAAIY